MNVALFASAFSPHLGGVEELCRQLAVECRRRGVGVVVLTNRWPRSLPRRDSVDGIDVVRLPFRFPDGSVKSWLNYQRTRRAVGRELLGVLGECQADLLHVQCVNASTAYAVEAHRQLSLPMVVTTQGERTMDATGLFQRSPRMVRVFKSALDEAAAVTACSTDTLRDVRQNLGFSGGRVIYNGVRTADFEGPHDPVASRPYVLAIGRHVPQKGFDVLLRAWAKVADRSHELLLAGDGPERANLEHLARDLNVTGRVRFFGRADRQAAIRLFRGCSFFVLPSRIEPLGIVNLEAMAAGKAVIASSTGGVPELVENGSTGLLVPPGDADALGSAMSALIADPARRETLGRAGRVRAAQFDWSRIADEYLALYESVLNHRVRNRTDVNVEQ